MAVHVWHSKYQLICLKAITVRDTTSWPWVRFQLNLHGLKPLHVSPEQAGNITVLPPYFGMTKSQCSRRGQNHKTSVASHITVLHLLPSTSPPSTTFFHPCFCQKLTNKCTCLDLCSSTAPWRFHFTPPPLPPLRLCSPSPCIWLSQWVIRWKSAFSPQGTVIFRLHNGLIMAFGRQVKQL